MNTTLFRPLPCGEVATSNTLHLIAMKTLFYILVLVLITQLPGFIRCNWPAPEPSPYVEDIADRHIWVTCQSLTLRSAPYPQAPGIDTIRHGERLRCLLRTDTLIEISERNGRKYRGHMYKVRTIRGLEGWIFASGELISFSDPAVKQDDYFKRPVFAYSAGPAPAISSSTAPIRHYPHEPHLEEAHLLKHYRKAHDYRSATVQALAKQLAKRSPGSFNLGQVCEIYDYCLSQWTYVNDPAFDDFPSSGTATIHHDYAGDCDDFALLISALVTAVGGISRINLANSETAGHAFTEIYLGNEEPAGYMAYLNERYQQGRFPGLRLDPFGGWWLNLDWQYQQERHYPGGPYFDYRRGVMLYLDLNLCQDIRRDEQYLWQIGDEEDITDEETDWPLAEGPIWGQVLTEQHPLRLRSSCDFSSPENIIDRLPSGTWVQVWAIEGDCAYVETETGKTGWVAHSYLWW